MNWKERTKGLWTANYNGCFAMIFRAPGSWQRWAWEVRFGSEVASGVVMLKREASAACWRWTYNRLRQVEQDFRAQSRAPQGGAS